MAGELLLEGQIGMEETIAIDGAQVDSGIPKK
jgi:hypothetical protein